jgi:hypothetical protein
VKRRSAAARLAAVGRWQRTGGSITARDVARSLELDEAETDTLLTELAKIRKGQRHLDFDDQGRIHYLFGGTSKRASRVARPSSRIPPQTGSAPETDPCTAKPIS